MASLRAIAKTATPIPFNRTNRRNSAPNAVLEFIKMVAVIRSADPIRVEVESRFLLERGLPSLIASLGDNFDTVCFISRQVRQKAISIQRLLRMILGARTEKTRAALNRGVVVEPATETPGEKPPRKEHGRRAANAYWGRKKIQVSHSRLKVGRKCPTCNQGQLYDTGRPSVLLHLQAQPVIAGTVFELEKLRCAACGQLFSATPPTAKSSSMTTPRSKS